MNKNSLKSGLSLAFCLSVMDPWGGWEDRCAPQVCCHTKPNEEPYLDREQVTMPAHTSIDACKQPASFSAGSYRIAEQLRKSRYMGKGREKERKQASKEDIHNFQTISHHSYLFPKSACEQPRNWRVWLVFPMLLEAAHSFQHRIGLCNPLINYWWATQNSCSLFWNCFCISPSRGELTSHHRTLSNSCHPCLDFVKSGFAIFLSFRCLTCSLSCPASLPENGHSGTEYKARDAIWSSTVTNTGGNKCLKTELQLHSRVTARALPATEQTCKQKGPGSSLMKQPSSNGSQKDKFKKHSQINWQLGSLPPWSLQYSCRDGFVWNTFFHLYFNVFLQRQ